MIYEKLRLNSFYEYIRTKTFLTVLFLYSVITLVMTYPLVFNLFTHIAGWIDVWQNLWLLWHTKFALAEPSESIFFTNYLYYPTGTPLIPMSIYNQFLSVPLQYVFSLSVTYNLLFISNFIIAGITTFYLIKYLTNNNYAAFIGGLVYAFSPNMFAHALGHMEAITIGWIPLYVLFLLKLKEEKSSFKEEVKSAALAGFGLILVSASDLIYMMFTIIFTAIFIIYWIIINRSFSFIISKRFIMFCGIFLVGVIPFTYPLIQQSLSEENFLKPQIVESAIYSADLAGFFVPYQFHPIFGEFASNISKSFTGNVSEYTTFLGYTIIILIAFVFIRVKGQNVTLWKISFLLAILLSLGPVLHIMGNTLFFGKPLFLPFYFLHNYFPFLQNSRTPVRMDVLVMLFAAVLTGYGISRLFENLKQSGKKIAAGVISSLILFEFLAIPIPISEVDLPGFYTNISMNEGKNIVLVEVPMDYNYGTKAMFYQTVHGKKLIGGALARVPPYVYDFMETTPVIYELSSFEDGLTDIIVQNNTEKSQTGLAILNNYSIKYIIINTNYLNNSQFMNVSHTMEELDAKKIEQNEGRIIYMIPEIYPVSYAYIDKGWYKVDKLNDIPTRWMGSNANIRVYSNTNRSAIISFQAIGFYHARNVEIYVNDRLEGQINALLKYTNATKTQISLREGENNIRFHVIEGCERPMDIRGLNSKDNRCLGIKLWNITIT